MHSSNDYHRSKWNHSPKQPTWNHSRRSIFQNHPYLMREPFVPTIINHDYNHFLNILYHHIELSSFTNYYCSTTQPTWANNRLANYDYGCYYGYHDWLRLTQTRPAALSSLDPPVLLQPQQLCFDPLQLLHAPQAAVNQIFDPRDEEIYGGSGSGNHCETVNKTTKKDNDAAITSAFVCYRKKWIGNSLWGRTMTMILHVKPLWWTNNGDTPRWYQTIKSFRARNDPVWRCPFGTFHDRNDSTHQPVLGPSSFEETPKKGEKKNPPNGGTLVPIVDFSSVGVLSQFLIFLLQHLELSHTRKLTMLCDAPWRYPHSRELGWKEG